MIKPMIESTFKLLAENGKMKELLKNLVDKPEYSLRFLIIANTLKDAINCGFYVSQSLNNKDIPEEKRKFVAALDMANGVLMIGAQLLLGFKFTSEKAQKKMNEFLFGGLEDKAENFIKARILSHSTDFVSDFRVKLRNSVKSIPEGCKKGFKAISTIVVTTVIAKRIIVPFIATPTATWLKDKYMTKKPVEEPNTLAVSKPAVPQNLQKPNSITPEAYAVKNNLGVNKYSVYNFNNFTQTGVIGR